MGCGCNGSKWSAEQTAARNAKIEAKKASAPTGRQRELIPGGYWNGPKAKKG